MKRLIFLCSCVMFFSILMGACVPITFSPPTEIHINPGDHVEQAVIAVDADGRSHIAGVVNDRIVYYRTHLGYPSRKLTFTMSSSGTDWVQYHPDIAVLDNGMAYIVWIEQHGGPEKFACYRNVPLIPPVGGYTTYCAPLDGTNQSTGNIWVTARGGTAYVIYDRIYEGRIAELWYKELTKLPPNSGRVYWYTEYFETGYIYSLDMAIDSGGRLHVTYLDNFTFTGSPPYTDRLIYRSNVTTYIDGTMTQGWAIASGESLGQDVDVSLSFYTDAGIERVAVASIWVPFGLDSIYIDSCDVAGCANHHTHQVFLPSSWNAFSVIDDIEILGIDTNLYLGFIGDDNTSTTGVEQVYYKNAFSTNDPGEPSEDTATFKMDLEMTRVDPRPESSISQPFPVMAWAESDIVTTKFYAYDGLFFKTLVYNTTCGTSFPAGDIGSNGYYFSGDWDACLNTWFSSQAWLNNLPLVLK
ncbi:MAG: hypothetical protein P1P73_11890 [Brevefilum sp.]|nr:hypothetical protein [Brevefilum sp.]